jgi:hypothetical protein
MDPSSSNSDLMHQPGTVFLMLGLILLLLFLAVVSLRNVRLWLLRFAGVPTIGIVDAIEFVTEPTGEVLRRPRIRYTDGNGTVVQSSPVLFRTTSNLAVGAVVPIRYASDRPERMVVRAFDTRVRELVSAAISLAAAIAIATFYFAHL